MVGDLVDVEHPDRATDALEMYIVDLFTRSRPVRGVKDALGGKYLPWPGCVTQSGSEVRDCSDGGVVEAPFEPDAAQSGKALGDPDAQGQIVVAQLPSSGKVPDPVPHLHRHPD